MIQPALHSSKRMDWPTPWPLFRELDAEFHFEIDVCASASNSKCDRYFTIEDNALDRDWAPLICWMNPPYGRAIGRWMEKALSESRNGATVVCLIPSRTDTRWWHEYATAGEIRFIRGRIKFEGAEHVAPFPSAIVVFSPPVPRKAVK